MIHMKVMLMFSARIQNAIRAIIGSMDTNTLY